MPVRVDADARPDVYARYHLGGLPSTALLDGGRRLRSWRDVPGAAQCLGLLDAALADLAPAAGRRPPAATRARRGGRRCSPEPWWTTSSMRLRRRADPEHGGFGVAPKLPEPDAVTLLLRRGARHPTIASSASASRAPPSTRSPRTWWIRTTAASSATAPGGLVRPAHREARARPGRADPAVPRGVPARSASRATPTSRAAPSTTRGAVVDAQGRALSSVAADARLLRAPRPPPRRAGRCPRSTRAASPTPTAAMASAALHARPGRGDA